MVDGESGLEACGLGGEGRIEGRGCGEDVLGKCLGVGPELFLRWGKGEVYHDESMEICLVNNPHGIRPLLYAYSYEHHCGVCRSACSQHHLSNGCRLLIGRSIHFHSVVRAGRECGVKGFEAKEMGYLIVTPGSRPKWQRCRIIANLKCPLTWIGHGSRAPFSSSPVGASLLLLDVCLPRSRAQRARASLRARLPRPCSLPVTCSVFQAESAALLVVPRSSLLML